MPVRSAVLPIGGTKLNWIVGVPGPPGIVDGATLTVTLAEAVSVLPVQRTSNVAFDVRLPVLCDPEVPVQPRGETLHAVAFTDDQLMVAVAPYSMLQLPFAPLQEISADTTGDGGGAAPTSTLMLAVASPTLPVQRSSNVALAVRLLVRCDPEVPLQPLGVTVQEVALVDDQLMVAAAP
jgi:hypothetical protein